MLRLFEIYLDDPAASLHYNRRCAHKPFNHGWGCYNTTISIQGEGDYDGRVCYCQDDLCNTEM